MSYNDLARVHAPGPDCAQFAALLPVLDEDTIDLDKADRARAHLARCSYCRAQLAAYDRVEAGLRRHFGVTLTTPHMLEEIMSSILEPDTVIVHDSIEPSHSAPPPRGSRRVFSSLAALAAVLVLSLLATAIFISHPRVSPVTTHPNTVLPKGAELSLSGVSMVSANEGWAAGTYAPPENSSGKGSAVLYHYLNGSWTGSDVTVNVPGQPRLNAISMDSPDDGWAVGGVMNGQSAAILLHYDGHAWTQVRSSIQANLGAVQMLSPTSGWALSTMGESAIFHYDGTAWTQQPVPAVSSGGRQYSLDLLSLTMTSPDDGWAVGSALPPARMVGNAGYPSAPPTGVILHYTGGKWRIQQLIPGSTIRSLAMVAPDDGWAVGNDDIYQHLTSDPDPNDVADIQHMLLLHYTAGRWVKAPVPIADPLRLTGSLGPISMLSRNDGWIAGYSQTGTITEPDQAPNALILLHYDGARWTEVATPTVKNVREYSILSLSMSSPSDGWAVGQSFSTAENGVPNPDGLGYTPTVTPLILRYHDGAWTVYSS